MSLDPQLEGRLLAIEIVLATMAAGAAVGRPNMLERMHELLGNRIRESAENVAGEHSDVPPIVQMAYVEVACTSLDKIIGMAQALR